MSASLEERIAVGVLFDALRVLAGECLHWRSDEARGADNWMLYDCDRCGCPAFCHPTTTRL